MALGIGPAPVDEVLKFNLFDRDPWIPSFVTYGTPLNLREVGSGINGSRFVVDGTPLFSMN
ncbi:MAG: hypothetical protein K2P94_05795 [Rhodospirillaceae bacterium]|nr:hypothetical protein [Rhodospirillaceae bacterium]